MTIEQICRRLRRELEEYEKAGVDTSGHPATDNFAEAVRPLLRELLSRLYEIGLEDTSRPITEPPGPPDEDPEEEKT